MAKLNLGAEPCEPPLRPRAQGVGLGTEWFVGNAADLLVTVCVSCFIFAGIEASFLRRVSFSFEALVGPCLGTTERSSSKTFSTFLLIAAML